MGLEPAREVVDCDEVCEMSLQMFVVVVVEAFDGHAFDSAAHELDLRWSRGG